MMETRFNRLMDLVWAFLWLFLGMGINAPFLGVMAAIQFAMIVIFTIDDFLGPEEKITRVQNLMDSYKWTPETRRLLEDWTENDL